MLMNVFPFPSYYFFNEKECRPGRNGHWQGLGNRLPLILRQSMAVEIQAAAPLRYLVLRPLLHSTAGRWLPT